MSERRSPISDDIEELEGLEGLERLDPVEGPLRSEKAPLLAPDGEAGCC
jgi:hypothetical protein